MPIQDDLWCWEKGVQIKGQVTWRKSKALASKLFGREHSVISSAETFDGSRSRLHLSALRQGCGVESAHFQAIWTGAQCDLIGGDFCLEPFAASLLCGAAGLRSAAQAMCEKR